MIVVWTTISGRRTEEAWTRDAEETRENWKVEGWEEEERTWSYKEGNKGEPIRSEEFLKMATVVGIMHVLTLAQKLAH